MPLAQGTVGQTQKSGDGTSPATGFRQGNYNEMIVTELQPRYYEQALRRNGFVAATQGGVTTSVGLSTTHTGLVISNAPGNTVNLVMLKFGMAQSIINAAVNAFGLAVGYNSGTAVTHTTPVSPRSSLLGSPAGGQALADVSATLPTAPTYAMFLQSTPTATTNPNGIWVDLEGFFIIPPGGYICTAAIAASPGSACWFAFNWLEVPI